MQMTLKAAKDNFFDRKAVIDAIGKVQASVLGRQGALVRKIDRSSQRKRKGASKPGQPPSVHTGKLKDFTFFAWDPSTKTVVVGPVGFGDSQAPATLEYGGKVKVPGYVNRKGEFRPLHLTPYSTRRRIINSGKVVVKTLPLEARPHTNAALAKAKDKFPELWKDQVRK